MGCVPPWHPSPGKALGPPSAEAEGHRKALGERRAVREHKTLEIDRWSCVSCKVAAPFGDALQSCLQYDPAK